MGAGPCRAEALPVAPCRSALTTQKTFQTTSAKIRTMNKAVDRVVDIMVEKVADQRPVRISALHANAPREAEQLLQKVCERFHPRDIAEAFSSGVSPVIGTHTGPGTVGLAFMAGI